MALTPAQRLDILEPRVDSLEKRLSALTSRVSALEATPAPTPPTPPPTPPVPPVPPGTQTPAQPVSLKAGTNLLTDVSITAPQGAGIVGDNATAVTTLTLTRVKVRSLNYALYCGSCVDATLLGCDFETQGGGDDYVIRGAFDKFHSQFGRYHCSGTKAALRIYFCNSFSSVSDVFEGGRLMLGGGSSAESANQGSFSGTLSGSSIKCSSVEVYAKSVVTFNRCDFTGSGWLTPWDGCSIIFNQCTKDGKPLTAAFCKNGARGCVFNN